LAIADGLTVEIWGLPEQRLAKSFPRRHPGQGDLGFVVGLNGSGEPLHVGPTVGRDLSTTGAF